MSSVTEEAIDTFEQSDNAHQSLKKSQNKQFNNIVNIKYQHKNDHSYISEESDYEEEEDEEECESEISEETEQQPINYNYRGDRYHNMRENIQRSIDSSNFHSSIEYDNNDSRFSNWTKLLRLPRNTQAFHQLLEKGIHPAFRYLYEKYPIEERDLYEKYIKILSWLGHWCEFLTDVDFFPVLVFPFVKLIEQSDIIICETIMSVILNWCKNWFEYYPNEPAHILQIINEIFQHEDFELYQHLKIKGFIAKDYAWPNIKQLFSEIMHEEDWCILMDILFSYPEKQNLIYYFTAAMIIEHREEIFQISNIEELKWYNYPFIQNNIPELMSRALSYHDYYNEALTKQLGLDKNQLHSDLPSFRNTSLFPLPSGYYPTFSQHPKKYDPITKLEQTINQDVQIARSNLDTITNRQFWEINQEIKSAIHRSEMIRLEEENMRKLYLEKEQRLIDQNERDKQVWDERIQKAEEMEKYMAESLQINDTTSRLRTQSTAPIQDQFRSQLLSLQEQTRSRLEEEKIMEDEIKSKRRMMELLSQQAREDRNDYLTKEWINLERERELFAQRRSMEEAGRSKINFIKRRNQENTGSHRSAHNK